MSEPIDSVLRNAVWQQLLDAERLARYHGELADRYQRRQTLIRLAMAGASAIGAIGLIIQVEQWTSPAAILIMIAAVVWDFLHNDGKKAAILYSISVDCGEYETKLRVMWRALDAGPGFDEDTIRTNLLEIEQGMERATARSGYADIRVDEKLNLKTTLEAYTGVEARHATGG